MIPSTAGGLPYDANTDDVDSLGDLMSHVLDNVVGVFEQAGIELPERRYIAYGGVAHDCEQVTVSFIQMYLGPPGDQAAQPQRCDAPRTAVLALQIARCLPASGPRGSAPIADSISEHALSQSRDAWLLMEAGATSVDAWGLGVLADVAVTEPQGGYQAVVLNLILAVP